MGLTPEQFGENLRDGYPRNHIEQSHQTVDEVASELIGNVYKSKEEVIQAGKDMMIYQLSLEVDVRQAVRKQVFERAVIHVRPTRLGMKEISEDHICWRIRFLSNKPVAMLERTEYLHIQEAVDAGLLEAVMTVEPVGIEEDNEDAAISLLYLTQQLFHHEDFMDAAVRWNEIRKDIVTDLLEKVLFEKEAKIFKISFSYF